MNIELLRTSHNKVLVRGMMCFDTALRGIELGHSMMLKGSTVVFDFSEVYLSDSSGLAVLIDWLRFARRNQVTVKFCNIPTKMMELGRVSSLDTIFPLL